ncbi:MAG: extracellular solute-binding protein [Sphaerochaetaceae bacterium]|nr:extracellular solute-binding protein [Sphaerochaetaceae bacterium]
MNKKMHFIFIVIIFTISIVFTAGCAKEEAVKKQSDTNTLYLYNWTYYTPESVIEKFEEEFNAKVVLDYFGSNEDMFAKLKAGGSGYDIVFPSQDYVSIMMTLDMLTPIDLEKIPNSRYISDLALSKATYDPLMNYSVPYFMGAAGIAVNTKKVTDYPRDWSIFSQTKLKNRMSMLDDMREVMGDALAHLGYSVNTTDEKELKEAQQLINGEWKPNLTKFDAEGFAKSFSSGEFYVVQGYAEAIFEEIEEDRWDDVDFFLPEEGGPMYLDSMVIPKGAKHIELAHQFIDFIHRPEIYAEFLDRFRFPSSVHTEAMNYTTKEPFYVESDLANYELKNDLGENLAAYDEIWQTVRYTD